MAQHPMDPSGGVPLDQRRWWSVVVGAAAGWIALVHVTLWWLDRRQVPRTLWGDENTYLTSAMELLAGDPGWWPEPLWPPLYSQFVAGLMWLSRGSMTGVIVVQSFLLAAIAVLFFDLTRRFTNSRTAGLAVAALTLGYPPLVAFCHYLWPEILHLWLFAALLWILAVRGQKSVWCAIAGVVLGLALLSKSLLLPFVPLLLAMAVWGSRPGGAILRIALVLSMAAVTVAPTVVSNARRTGTPMIANSGAFNLWVGLNDVGRESFRHDVAWPEYQRWLASADTYAGRDRILRTQIGDLIRDRGWAIVLRNQLSKQYFRLFDAGCYLTDQLPGGAAYERARAGYLGAGLKLGQAMTGVTLVSILVLLVAAPVGMIFGGCRGNRWVRTMIVFLVYNLLIFFWLHVKTRYRIQMLPAAFVGVGCLVAWMEAGFQPRPSKARITATGVVVGLLMWFALG